jgi:uncharacterized protein YuzE
MHLNDIAALKVGDRIRATDDIELDHHAYVERGETGTVVAIEVEVGDRAPMTFDSPPERKAASRRERGQRGLVAH